MGKPAASKQSVPSATPPETTPMDSTNPLVPSNPASEAAPTATGQPTASTAPLAPPTPQPPAVPETAPTAAPTPPASTPPEAPPPAPPVPPPPQPSLSDPFDPRSLHLGSDYAAGLGVRRVITTIPVRKPSKDEWFRCRPGGDWTLTTAVLEVEKGVERSTYLLARGLWTEYSGEVTPAMIRVCANRQGDFFAWRLKLPGSDGRANSWTESALEIARAAETTWCRMKSDMTNGIYTHFVPADDVVLPEPAWPVDLTMGDIIKIAFRGRMIETADHPVLRELRGEL